MAKATDPPTSLIWRSMQSMKTARPRHHHRRKRQERYRSPVHQLIAVRPPQTRPVLKNLSKLMLMSILRLLLSICLIKCKFNRLHNQKWHREVTKTTCELWNWRRRPSNTTKCSSTGRVSIREHRRSTLSLTVS